MLKFKKIKNFSTLLVSKRTANFEVGKRHIKNLFIPIKVFYFRLNRTQMFADLALIIYIYGSLKTETMKWEFRRGMIIR